MSTALDDFFSAWSETDAATRADMLGAAMAPVFTYSDPRSEGRLTSLPQLADYVGQFSANAPGWTARVVASDAVNGYARAAVRFSGSGPDGAEASQHGTYFADFDGDGRIAMLAGFRGTEAAG